MKRSEINLAILTAKEVLAKHSFHLPPFAHMTPADWQSIGTEYRRIIENRLGWDITDFGGNDFHNFGAVLFTLRNGNYLNAANGTPYAEKIIILEPGQRLPLHFHWSKTEDIINRGGGILTMELYNATEDSKVDSVSNVVVFCDGMEKVVKPGEVFDIGQGGSITLTPGLYHRFWANREGGILICGEVSTVNDDVTDNYFAEPVRRFADIEEDEEPVHLLCNEYLKGKKEDGCTNG